MTVKTEEEDCITFRWSFACSFPLQADQSVVILERLCCKTTVWRRTLWSTCSLHNTYRLVHFSWRMKRVYKRCQTCHSLPWFEENNFTDKPFCPRSYYSNFLSCDYTVFMQTEWCFFNFEGCPSWVFCCIRRRNRCMSCVSEQKNNSIKNNKAQ